MRHGEGKDEARELYVNQHYTFDEIARRIGRSDKTVRTWAEEDGWKQSRESLFQDKKTIHEKLHQVADSLASRIIQDANDGSPLSPQAIHALSNIVAIMNDSYAYAAKAKTEADSNKPKSQDGLTDETLQKIEQQLALL